MWHDVYNHAREMLFFANREYNYKNCRYFVTVFALQHLNCIYIIPSAQNDSDSHLFLSIETTEVLDENSLLHYLLVTAEFVILMQSFISSDS